MAKHHHRSRIRKLKKALSVSFFRAIGSLAPVKDVMFQFLYAAKILRRGKRRHSRDFERAGRETPKVDWIDNKAAAELNQADKVRDREIIQQVRYENRTLRRKNEEAKSLRQEMESDSLSVSQGSAISHLAKMNQRHSKKDRTEKQNDQPDSSES